MQVPTLANTASASPIGYQGGGNAGNNNGAPGQGLGRARRGHLPRACRNCPGHERHPRRGHRRRFARRLRARDRDLQRTTSRSASTTTCGRLRRRLLELHPHRQRQRRDERQHPPAHPAAVQRQLQRRQYGRRNADVVRASPRSPRPAPAHGPSTTTTTGRAARSSTRELLVLNLTPGAAQLHGRPGH